MIGLNYYGYDFIRESDLTHHGIKGQKWGQRRFQNEDGTWTAAGKERYGNGGNTGSSEGSVHSFKGNLHRALAANYGLNAKAYSKSNKTLASVNRQAQNAQLKKAAEADAAKAKKMNDPEHQKRVANLKKAAKIGAVVAGTALVAYGGYKLNKMATESLKAGDRYLAQHKKTMADMALKNYFDQMEIANKVKGSDPITSRTPIETAKKYQKMVETASQAGQRYNTYKKEASAALARADAGKYTLGEKVGAIKNIQNNKKLVRAENQRSNQRKRNERTDNLKYYAKRALPLAVLRRT